MLSQECRLEKEYLLDLGVTCRHSIKGASYE